VDGLAMTAGVRRRTWCKAHWRVHASCHFEPRSASQSAVARIRILGARARQR